MTPEIGAGVVRHQHGEPVVAQAQGPGQVQRPQRGPCPGGGGVRARPPAGSRREPESAASRPRAKAKPFRGGKKPKAVAVGAIGLEEGYLTPEQISLVLQHLPLDIVFVDAYDEVVYANHGEHRSIAQREVVDAFKAAQKDEAEFWRAENGRYFYIKFIAIRDDDGEYQGYLQVQQDITEIRQLKGEKRILDWE